MNTEKEVEYLKSLRSIKETSQKIFDLTTQQKSKHFNLNLEKLNKVADFVIELMNRDYSNLDSIKAHTRWRHFEFDSVKRIDDLISEWNLEDKIEITRRLIDLTIVSVLVDAGSGDNWAYQTVDNTIVKRSEGLAIASLDMFKKGYFSSDKKALHQVDAKGLMNLNLEQLKIAFQVDENNELIGTEHRLNLLRKLGQELLSNPKYFEFNHTFRPGNLIDYLLASTKSQTNIDVLNLWDVVINGLSGIWPKSRVEYKGYSLGDVWGSDTLGCMDYTNPKFENIVCFHKLSQWLTYSIIEPIEVILGYKIDTSLLTGLPEYRNGGLFIDMGVLQLKEDSYERGIKKTLNLNPKVDKEAALPTFEVYDYEIVEWRALTVVLLDKTAELIRNKLNLEKSQLPLAKVLEAGTWKAGREVAAKLRPQTKGPPIVTVSDGTVF